MKTATLSPRPPAPKTYFFGSFTVQHDPEKRTSALRVNFGRLAAVAGLALLLLYGAGTAAGYYWLHHVRKVREIGVADVALFRWKEVRREIAVQQFAKAKQAWAAKNYQAAYIAANSGLRNDPDNVGGRLLVAGFMQVAGSTDMAIKLLEDGLTRAPGNRELVRDTLDLMTTTEHDRAALTLLHGKLASGFSGPNGQLLRTFEVLATLNADGPVPARKLLDQYPALRQTPDAWPVVARVLWEAKEPMAAVATMEDFVKSQPGNYAGYAQLSDYQDAAGLVYDARQTAESACAKFPRDIGPRILLIGTLAPASAAEIPRWEQEVNRFLAGFGDRPEAILMLGNLSGRKGWVELARLMYEVAVIREQNARPLVLYYSDALMVHRRFDDARRVLAELDRQVEGDAVLEPLLWQREIVVASALGLHEEARETARRLATEFGRDPEQLEIIRQRFVRLGIPEAVAELAPHAPIAAAAAPKKS